MAFTDSPGLSSLHLCDGEDDQFLAIVLDVLVGGFSEAGVNRVDADPVGHAVFRIRKQQLSSAGGFDDDPMRPGRFHAGDEAGDAIVLQDAAEPLPILLVRSRRLLEEGIGHLDGEVVDVLPPCRFPLAAGDHLHHVAERGSLPEHVGPSAVRQRATCDLENFLQFLVLVFGLVVAADGIGVGDGIDAAQAVMATLVAEHDSS